jgi:subtilisin family serine protease
MRLFNRCTVAITLALAVTANALVDHVHDTIDSALLNEIKGSYIVKLRPGNEPKDFFGLGINLVGLIDVRVRIRHVFDYGRFQGFSGKLTNEEIAQLKRDRRVEYIEPDQIFHADAEQTDLLNWGLSRVSQRMLDLTQPYIYPDHAGEGIDVWVIDSGIQDNHTDFGGRAAQVKNFVTNETNTDLSGHGTHVAGIIGSATYGVAKKVNIYGVKVLNINNFGTTSNIIAGIQYAALHTRPGKTIINMSLSGSKSTSINDAVNAAVEAGAAVFVAAGNTQSDACDYSPSSATSAFTVAASDYYDVHASYSNYGRCVDIYAPGTSITSLWIGPDGVNRVSSGTSMATPHVAGVAALYLASGKYNTVAELYAALSENATPGVLIGVPSDTPNKLVYNQN